MAGKPPLCSRAARAPRGLGLGFWFVSCAHPPGSVGNRTPEFYFLMQREAELNEKSENGASTEMPLGARRLGAGGWSLWACALPPVLGAQLCDAEEAGLVPLHGSFCPWSAPSGLSVGRPCSGGPGVSSAEPRMFCAAAGTQPAGQGGD